jgi:hypothetical protein
MRHWASSVVCFRSNEVIRGAARSGARLALVVSIALGAACSSEAPSTPGGMGGVAGSFGVGGGPGSGGAGGAVAGSIPNCISNCFADGQTSVTPVFFENTWQCPEDSFDSASCPVGSCAVTPVRYCCDPTTGSITTPPCGDGYRLGCSTGQTETSTYMCLPPEVAPGTDCLRLNGQACPTVGHQCNDGSPICTCVGQGGGDAGATWSCSAGIPG